MGAKLMAVWGRAPLLVRALLTCFLVQNAGSTAGILPVFANTRWLPQLPWSLPVVSLLMLAFWRYCGGAGPPISTRAYRQQVTRLKRLPWPVWRAALPALLLSIVAVTSLRLLLPSLLPVDPPRMALDLGQFPTITVIGLALSVAIVAGVSEEVAFRGYLQQPLEQRYGIGAALLITGLAFWLAHADKVSWTHLPFHLAASITLGLSARLTQSLLPAVLGHTLADALLLPAYVYHQPEFVWRFLTARPVWEAQDAASLADKLQRVSQALDPTQMLEPGPQQALPILAWVFMLSAAASGLAFVALWRSVHRA